jgi:hypothetical protein
MKRSKPTFPRINPMHESRYFFSEKQVAEGAWSVSRLHSRLKREGKKVGSFFHHVCSCGCGMWAIETRTFPPHADAVKQPWPKVVRRKRTFHEVDGQRLNKIELPSGSVISV